MKVLRVLRHHRQGSFIILWTVKSNSFTPHVTAAGNRTGSEVHPFFFLPWEGRLDRNVWFNKLRLHESVELKIYIFKTTVENKKMDLKPVKILIFKDQQREKSSAVLMFLKCRALFLFNYRI